MANFIDGVAYFIGANLWMILAGVFLIVALYFGASWINEKLKKYENIDRQDYDEKVNAAKCFKRNNPQLNKVKAVFLLPRVEIDEDTQKVYKRPWPLGIFIGYLELDNLATPQTLDVLEIFKGLDPEQIKKEMAKRQNVYVLVYAVKMKPSNRYEEHAILAFGHQFDVTDHGVFIYGTSVKRQATTFWATVSGDVELHSYDSRIIMAHVYATNALNTAQAMASKNVYFAQTFSGLDANQKNTLEVVSAMAGIKDRKEEIRA